LSREKIPFNLFLVLIEYDVLITIFATTCDMSGEMNIGQYA
jgi:hypothetical protein